MFCISPTRKTYSLSVGYILQNFCFALQKYNKKSTYANKCRFFCYFLFNSLFYVARRYAQFISLCLFLYVAESDGLLLNLASGGCYLAANWRKTLPIVAHWIIDISLLLSAAKVRRIFDICKKKIEKSPKLSDFSTLASNFGRYEGEKRPRSFTHESRQIGRS